MVEQESNDLWSGTSSAASPSLAELKRTFDRAGFMFRCNPDQNCHASVRLPATTSSCSADRLNPTIAEVTQAIEQEVEKCRGTALDDSSRVAALTALAFVLIIGRANRFQCGKADRKLSGTGAIGGVQRRAVTAGTYHETRQLSFTILASRGGASHGAQRSRMAQQVFPPGNAPGRKIAKVAMARRLAVRLYWMWRKGWNYEQLKKFGSHAGQPVHRHGVQ